MAAISERTPFDLCSQLIQLESKASASINTHTYTLNQVIDRMNGINGIIEKVNNLKLPFAEELQKTLDEATTIFDQPIVLHPELLQKCYAKINAEWEKIMQHRLDPHKPLEQNEEKDPFQQAPDFSQVNSSDLHSVEKAIWDNANKIIQNVLCPPMDPPPYQDDEKEEQNFYETPDISKREPPLSVVDTRGKIRRKASFVPPTMGEFLIQTHPVQFQQIGDLPKEAHGVTRNGKHVLQQQAQHSSIPTAVAMLALDHNKHADLQATIMTFRTNEQDAQKWMRSAGLTPIFAQVPKQYPAQFLAEKLQENGAGILSLDHPLLGDHAVVLDEISIQKNEATIRDPFHGAALTVQLDLLMEWVQLSYFLQVKE
jgi:hypothetical protein